MKRLLLLSSLAFLFGCDEGEPVANTPPQTKISVEEINLVGENRLNSVVRLSWYGTDKDGYVVGYEVSLDNQTWGFTTLQDSTFQFDIPAGQDSVDINLYVRAIDNDSLRDPSPAELRIPLKNTPPVSEIDTDVQTKGTSIGVATYRWNATDQDGNETIIEAEVKFNNGAWYPIPPNQKLLTFVLDPNTPSGPTTAEVFFANENTPQSLSIDGLEAGGTNTMYLRTKDIANSYSEVDTAEAVTLVLPTSDLLVVSGQSSSVTNQYATILSNLSINYDFLDYGINGGELQPAFWSPTVNHILKQYDRLFIHSDAQVFQNQATGQTGPLLALMGPAVQEFTDAGKKILVTTSFGTLSDVSGIVGTYPMTDVVRSSGLVRVYPDSATYPVTDSATYPLLQSNNVLVGITPIVKSADAEDYYRTELTPLSGWQGDNLVGVRRRFQGNVSQVLFSMELWRFNKNPQDLENLIDEILTNDFDW
ncbi:MAG: hypothetical protein HWE14_06375 [Flavobacteriia bacterium]|nr:hypothetical protein [Flavobacteriia bacterium]